MADLTVSTEQLTKLHPVLQAIGPLSPPPSAKGRYALRKLTEKAEAAFATFAKVELELTQRCAVEGSLKDAGNGMSTFTLKPECAEEYHKERAAVLAEPVELTGCRVVTLAELGQCPITVAMEKVLVQCGVLEDAEPAA